MLGRLPPGTPPAWIVRTSFARSSNPAFTPTGTLAITRRVTSIVTAAPTQGAAAVTATAQAASPSL